MKVYLETERLLLREFSEEDGPLLVLLESDPEVMRFLTGGRPTPTEILLNDRLPFYLECHRCGSGYGLWVALEKATGDFLGRFHLRPNDGGPPDVPELGYRLVRACWGKGYATEGSRALIRKAFEELGANKVIASTMTVNKGSRRVMEKAGMTFVRTFYMDWPEVIEGSEFGDVEYAITREEWESGEREL